jgi:uncharacterized protein (TIGR04255 family)
MSEIYKNAPLIEAIFEIRFPAEISIKCKTDLFYNKIKANFPLLAMLPPGASHIYDFLNKEKNEIIRVGLDRISYHAKKYEGGFSKFQEDALKYLYCFIDTYQIGKIRQTGLRYVNHIPIVKIDGVIPLEKYINFGYRLPSKNIPNKFELLNTILVVRIDGGKLKILIEAKQMPDITKTDILVLDFDFMFFEKLDVKKIVEYIAESHGHTKAIFEDLISEEYKKVMEGDKL